MKKVIDIEERIPSLREKRRKRTNRKFLLILSVFVGALLIILYFQSPLSRINEVRVSGANLNVQNFYKEESGLLLDKPLWGFTTESVEKSLQEIDTVKSVSVSRKWLRDIEIKISEWETIAYIEEEEHYNLLLGSGDIFSAEHVIPEEKAPILNGFSDTKNRKRITDQLLKLDKDVYQLISEIILKDEESSNKLIVYMDDGYEIRAIISTFADQMAYYPEIIAQLHEYEKGVIDMEVGTFFTPFSKVYDVSKEEEEVAEESE